MGKLQVLIVDDSIVYRKIIVAAVEGTGCVSVVQSASNGIIALERIDQGRFDVVLLDVNMPEMDGIETLSRIKRKHPEVSVIMVSSTEGKNAEITLKALEMGAMDFIMKPLEENYERNMQILQNYLQGLFAQVILKRMESGKRSGFVELKNVEGIRTNLNVQPFEKKRMTGIDLVVIASSTGGPVALEKVLTGLPDDFVKPILVVQHMPEGFTGVMAESLDKKCKQHVMEGKNGDVVRAGQIIIAPGGSHMVLKKEHALRIIELQKTAYVNGVRPSADILFKSVAQQYEKSRILAIVLTGMGSDGMEGVAELKKKCCCYCITQSEESCVVYGMPRSVVEAGLGDEILNIGEIALRIQQIVKG